MEREQMNLNEQVQNQDAAHADRSGGSQTDPADRSAAPVHPKLAGKPPSSVAAQVPEPDAIRPDSSPEWRELFKEVRRAVDRLRE